MALEGELNGVEGTICMDCGAELPLMVCMSAAGYYLGYKCNCCGPYSRESGYFRSHEEAEKALRGEAERQLRSTGFYKAIPDIEGTGKGGV